MQNIQTKISQAKSRLLLSYPFFGALAAKLELIQNDDIQSFKSNGIKLEYNSDFLQKLEPAQMEFVFANGAMHASLAHEARKNGRSGWLWQLSTDYAINDMLVQNGLDRPDEAHYSKRFSGMYAEEIYAQLKEDILRDELEYEADDACDTQESKKEQKEPNPPQKTDTLSEQLFSEFAKAKLEDEAKSSEMPIGMERFFSIEDRGKVDWRRELKAALERFYRDDYVLIPPSKKLLYRGIYLPSPTSERFSIVVAVDSSGSVDEKLLNAFLGELNFLMLSVPNFQIDMLVCDDKIRTRKTFYSGDILEVDIKGGGGTDFRPVFDLIDKELPYAKLLLYFTDLDGVFPDYAPNYEVKWIAPQEAEVPFGTTIVLE